MSELQTDERGALVVPQDFREDWQEYVAEDDDEESQAEEESEDE